MTDLINKEGLKLPLVALRDMVVFPRGFGPALM